MRGLRRGLDAVAAQRNSELEKAADANHTMVYPNRREHATTQSGRNFAVSAMLCRRKDATVYFVRTGSFGTDATVHLLQTQRFISKQTCSASTKGTTYYGKHANSSSNNTHKTPSFLLEGMSISYLFLRSLSYS